MCHGRKLDGPEALVEEARRAGLDAQRFRIDLESHGTLEAFGGDLEETRTISDPAREAGLATEGTHGSTLERLQFPAVRFGDDRWVGGDHSYEEWRAAATAAGAAPRGEPPPDVLTALNRFGTMATAELEAVCDLPGPRAGAEVWRLASEWRVRRIPVLSGELWAAYEPAAEALAATTDQALLRELDDARARSGAADHRGAGVMALEQLERGVGVVARHDDAEAAAHVEHLVHLGVAPRRPARRSVPKTGGTAAASRSGSPPPPPGAAG